MAEAAAAEAAVIELVSAVTAAFNELSQRTKTAETVLIDDEHDCYLVSDFPNLESIVSKQLEDAAYVSVEDQKDPDTNEKVFSLCFFDEDEELLGGLCLTKQQVYWDDDGDDNEDNEDNEDDSD